MNGLTRRQILKRGGAGLAAATALAACAPAPAAIPPLRPTTVPTHVDDLAAATSVPAAPTKSAREQADEMDAMHEQGVKVFLDNIGKEPTYWNNYLDFEMDGDVKVFELTCTELDWEVAAGQVVKAMAYNGIVPGPEIRVTEGETIRVHVTNNMNESTAVHWHGVAVPNSMDGVPFITQPPIKPGETFTYEFVAKPAGSHMYHSHHNAAEQVTKGLMGAIIVEPKDKSNEPKTDADYTMILNDTGVGLTINGRSFPYTQPILAKLGDKIRVRYMNEGLMIHPMHLHGIAQLVYSKDGYPLPQPYLCDTLNIAPGERYDVIIDCDSPGAWAYHCHILNHAESRHGMFGMVTALVVSE
ncbi:MAG: copper oxidase [Ardenticatenales bacterium]|nr:copper oxidase [Ardenticatenales bacterium]